MNTTEKQTLLKELGAAIGEIRESKKLSINKLAELAVIEDAYLLQIENGDVDIPFTEMVVIAKALNCTIQQLLPL
jgi:transcriptional regulator with XRE-family HTH domain